ncbi:hypothetical protein MMC16_002087 [Acarospora aff. strigata]|nr:hypothetical protein [Acarospora aff. strigata]
MSSPPINKTNDTTTNDNEFSNLLTSFNTTAAQTYEHRLGNATRAVARHILPFLSPLPPNPVVLDNACGTGSFTTELLRTVPTAHVHAVDASPAMIDIIRTSFNTDTHVDPAVMDGTSLSFPADTFDASVTNFGLFFFPDPAAGAREIYRTLKPHGGVAAVTCWRAIGFLPVFYAVQERVAPKEPLQGLPQIERWMDGGVLKETMVGAGFGAEGLRLESVGVVLWGEGVEDLAGCLVENFRGMVGEKWSEDEKGRLPEVTERVLREGRERFCVEGEGGKVGVEMAAWIAVGRK